MLSRRKTQVIYEFSDFRLDPDQRTLMRNGEPVTLAPKPFDTLLFMLQNRGRTLEKNEFMKALWPESFVEEGNLSQNIFVVRRVLGDGQNGRFFIKTIPRRGYQFIASVRQVDIPNAAMQSSLQAEYWSRHSPFRGLQTFEPEDAWLFIGRESETKDLLVRLGRYPVLIVIGNSGCGKSSVVRAGMIPALYSGRFLHEGEPVDSWRVAIFRPSGAPFNHLAEVLVNQLSPELSQKAHPELLAACQRTLSLGG